MRRGMMRRTRTDYRGKDAIVLDFIVYSCRHARAFAARRITTINVHPWISSNENSGLAIVPTMSHGKFVRNRVSNIRIYLNRALALEFAQLPAGDDSLG